MWQLTIAGVRANAGRWVSSFLAIATAVAFVVGTLVFAATIDRSTTELTAGRSRSVDVAVRSATSIGAGFATSARPRIPDGVVDDVAAVPGIDHVAGIVQTIATVVGSDGTAIGTGATGGLGTSWIADPELSSWSLVEGRAPEGPLEVVLDAPTAAAGGYHPGESVPVITRRGRSSYTLVGTASTGGTEPGGASTVLWTPAEAQSVAGADGAYDSVVATGDGSEDQLALAVALALDDPAYQVVTGGELRSEQSGALSDGLAFIDLMLLAFALIAVLVSALLIANTFTILVARRLRELALLRALGAGSLQLTGSVMAEALVLGASASVAGVGLGIGVALALTKVFARFGIPVGSGLVLSWPSAAAGLLLGTLVTVAAAAPPARRAASLPPIAALRRAGLPDAVLASRWRIAIGAAAALATTVSLAGALAGPPDSSFWLALAATLSALVAAHSLAPLVARRLASAAGSRLVAWSTAVATTAIAAWLTIGAATGGGRPAVTLAGAAGTGGLGLLMFRDARRSETSTGRLGRGNAMRNPSRTAATATTLMIGLALVTAVSVLAASMHATVADLLDGSLRADYVLSAPALGGASGVTPELASELSAVPGVEAVSGKRVGAARVGGHVVAVAALEPSTIGSLFDLGDDGRATTLDQGRLAVSRAAADENDWQIGDEVDVEFPGSAVQPSEIVAMFDTGAIGPRTSYLISTATFEANFPADAQVDRQVLVKVAADVLTDEARNELVRADLQDIVDQYPQVHLEDQATYRQAREEAVNRLVSLVYALLVLSVLIAVLGIINTLSLSVIERTREIGMLRAIGMTRSQLQESIRREAVIVALLGSLAGVLLGLPLGALLASSLEAQGIRVVSVPVGTGATVLLIGVVLGVVAALLPAWRASRLPVLKAMADR